MMTRLHLALILLMFCSQSETAALSGIIGSDNGHWGIGGNVPSPVIIDGNVRVQGQQTLLVEPGTEIVLEQDSYIYFENESRLDAKGTLAEPIVIRGTKKTRHTIDFADSSSADISFMILEKIKGLNIYTTEEFRIANSILSTMQVGLAVWHVRNLSVTACTFYDMTACISFLGTIDSFKITNSILYGIASSTYCDDKVNLQSEAFSYNARHGSMDDSFLCGEILGAGSFRLEDNPFRDAANGNFHIKPSSPTIDAGDPAADYSNEPECGGKNTRVNMGAYGNTPEAACKADIGVIKPVSTESLRNHSDQGVMYDIRGRRIHPTGLSAGIRIIEGGSAAKAYRTEVHLRTGGEDH